MASSTAMPQTTRENPGAAFPSDLGDTVLVIAGADLSDTIYLGYTANYSAYVHYGERGCSSAVGDNDGAAVDRDRRGQGRRGEVEAGTVRIYGPNVPVMMV